MSYGNGTLEALADFGLEGQKLSGAGTAAAGLLGAAAGYALDPEHSPQAALMGGAMGAGAAHGLGTLLPKGAAAVSVKAAADLGVSLGPSGPGLSLLNPQKERLPGMHRWVPRETIEDVYRQFDMGVDPADIEDTASVVPAIASGAAAGGLTGLGLGRTPQLGALGAGVGAAAGLGGHLLNRDSRKKDVEDVVKSILAGEAKAEHHPAREAMPLTVATNIGM